MFGKLPLFFIIALQISAVSTFTQNNFENQFNNQIATIRSNSRLNLVRLQSTASVSNLVQIVSKIVLSKQQVTLDETTLEQIKSNFNFPGSSYSLGGINIIRLHTSAPQKFAKVLMGNVRTKANLLNDKMRLTAAVHVTVSREGRDLSQKEEVWGTSFTFGVSEQEDQSETQSNSSFGSKNNSQQQEKKNNSSDFTSENKNSNENPFGNKSPFETNNPFGNNNVFGRNTSPFGRRLNFFTNEKTSTYLVQIFVG